ncbi:hypothetical protein JR316_0000038 [Psilocybe cubensis]|nr:hypothetical protein JR316_0000038 [Psilocybe cubensis]KAH9485976.1 hypothetical protein JR316_0000038 [Psilocybe cubensis]
MVCGDEKVVVGHDIQSCTSVVTPVEIDVNPFLHQFPWLKNRTLLLVDTPGFDDTYLGDMEILTIIADWLKSAYKDHVLGGVLYLYDVTNDRYTGSARKNLDIFRGICGQDAFDIVVLGASKGGRISPELGQQRLKALKDTHWKEFISEGAEIVTIDDTRQSAKNAVAQVLHSFTKKREESKKQAAIKTPAVTRKEQKGILNSEDHITALAIQEELVDKKFIVPETSAGKELRVTLREVLEYEKKYLELAKRDGDEDEETKQELQNALEQIRKLSKQLEQLKVPLGRRLLSILR